MTIDSKEEVFAYFKKLSGAKRIEVLSGLVHSCIPLELRFLACLVESTARKDYVTLLEDEHKANSPHELQNLCSMDLLADISPFIRFPSVIPMPHPGSSRPSAPVSPNHIASNHSDNGSDDGKIKIQLAGVNQGGGSSSGGSNDHMSPPPMSVIPDVVNTTNYGQTRFNPGVMTVQAVNVHQPPGPAECILRNVREKIIVYLCLLSSTNRVAASILYEAFRKYLSADNLKKHLEVCSINMTGLSLINDDHHQNPNLPVLQGPSAGVSTQTSASLVSAFHVPILDPQLVAELTLIHTMAIYHPAFTYEAQAFLSLELEKLNELFTNLSPARIYSHHPSNQVGSMFIPSDTFVPSYNTQEQNNHPSVAGYMSQEPKRQPPPLSCYNCGAKSHTGPECTEETLDEATRDTNFQINFKNPAPIITVPTIMTQGHVIQVSTMPHQHPQSSTPPVPHSPATANNKVNNDVPNGPGSVTSRMNSINNCGANESPSHLPLKRSDSGNNQASPSSSVNQGNVGGGGPSSGSRRAPNQLYVAPHMRNRGGEESNTRSVNDGHNSREQPVRIVRIQNVNPRGEYGPHHHH